MQFDNKNLIKFLQKTGVDTRFVSIIDNKIYINNLKFSHFSRKKEEVFLAEYPQIEVIRSKIFQKICTRASRNLAHIIKPREKIFLVKSDYPVNFALNVILEPYQRKYGVKFIYGEDVENTKNLDIDSIASAITLDDEVENILNCMLNGQKVNLLSASEDLNGKKVIYPLINIPKSWIYSWIYPDITESKKQNYESSRDLLMFLETIVPDAKENLYKSALFISND
ncbi:MAG: ATPase [Methanobacterium sp.]